MHLHLVDINVCLANAWADAFRDFPEASVHHADILAIARHCVVSPANSYGFMDGGIDAAYLAFFGPKIQDVVQAAIARRPEGLLPVGASLSVRTGHPRVPYLIVAPTMTTPEMVETTHVYRAMRAVLRIAGADVELGRDVFCPGLATGVGRVLPDDAAVMMAQAYGDWKRTIPPPSV